MNHTLQLLTGRALLHSRKIKGRTAYVTVEVGGLMSEVPFCKIEKPPQMMPLQTMRQVEAWERLRNHVRIAR